LRWRNEWLLSRLAGLWHWEVEVWLWESKSGELWELLIYLSLDTIKILLQWENGKLIL
jgi:hypothetical protein